MMLLVLLLLEVAATLSFADTRHILCGRELAKAHSLYCYGLEAIPAEEEVNLPKFSETNVDYANFPKIPERFAYRAWRTVESSTYSASLVEACCLKPCHVSELLNHC